MTIDRQLESGATRGPLTREEAVNKTIARNAKGLRKRLGMTLQEVADRAGIAKSYLWELEQGKQTNPSIAKLMGLASGLGCSVDGLIGAETYMKPQLRPEAMRIAVQVDQLLRDALTSRRAERAASIRVAANPNPESNHE